MGKTKHEIHSVALLGFYEWRKATRLFFYYINLSIDFFFFSLFFFFFFFFSLSVYKQICSNYPW